MRGLKTLLLILMSLVIAICAFGCGTENTGFNDAEKVVGGDPAGYPAAEYPPAAYPADAGYYRDGFIPGSTGEFVAGDYAAGYYAPGDYDMGDYAAGKSNRYNSQISPGLITASAWNDNDHYAEFLKLFEKVEEEPGQEQDQENARTSDKNKFYVNGKDSDRFYHFLMNDRWGFYANERVIVRVDSESGAVAGAQIRYYDSAQHELYAVTDVNGVAYIFPDVEKGSFTVTAGGYSATGDFDKDDRDVTVFLGGAIERENLIKLMLVVDVTGSMGDEINYLKVELTDVVRRVALANEGVRIDLAMLFYRDDGDSEKFRYFDFLTVTEEENLRLALSNLNTQYATGGGDYPEAMDEAMEMAALKDWGDENSTKIIFHVFDAPPHSNPQNKTRYERAVRLAAQKGIRINPVTCSGADLLCEYLARETAIHTAGHYVYVTDHSGIGGSHYDPEIETAVVEKLNELMIRLINGYHSGEFAEPVPWVNPYEKRLDLNILQNVADHDWTGYTEIPGWFGAREFYGKGYTPTVNDDVTYTDPDECVKYLITPWPDYSDGGAFVTTITITDPNVTFFGLTIDTSVEKYDSVLKMIGLKREEKPDDDCEVWSNGDLKVSLIDYGGRRSVVISAPVSNRNNIVY